MWGALIGGILGAASGAAVSSAARNSEPSAVPYGDALRASTVTDAQYLPAMRQMAALAALGQSGRIQSVPGLGGEPGQQYLPNSVMRVDFTGKGDADIQAELSRQYAQAMLDLQNKYGVQFADQARQQLEMADPEWVRARSLLSGEIARDASGSAAANRPVASELDRQLLSEIGLGRGIDSSAASAIERSLASRGETGSSAGIQSKLETGTGADQRLYGRQQKALSYLRSGTSPEDVSYSRQQQGMSNMAAFLRGRSPTDLSAQLSSAQRGTMPFVSAPQLPGSLSQSNINAMTGQSARNFGYDVENQLNEIGGWYSGLGLAMQGVGTAAGFI